MRIHFERCQNPDIACVHTDFPLPRTYYKEGLGCTDSSLDEEDYDFVVNLGSAEGVISVSIFRYAAQIEKALLFSWDDLKPSIIEAFQRRFAPNGNLTEV